MGPSADKTGRQVLELRELHLQTAFTALCALLENFENKLGAVENGDMSRLLDIALLGCRERRVEYQHVCSSLPGRGRDFFNLSAAEICSRIGLVAVSLREAHRDQGIRGDEKRKLLACIRPEIPAEAYADKPSLSGAVIPLPVYLKYCQIKTPECS